MSELTERERAGGTGSAGAGSNGHGDDDAPIAVATVDAPPRPDEELDAPDVDAGGPIDGDGATRPSPWYARAGRRIVRRPVEWARRPWPTSRTVRFAVTAVTLIITTVVMMNVVHLNPLNMRSDLIFDNNTPTGGDMGAHVWRPAYLRDNLLPTLAAVGLEHGLVRRLPDVPLLHGGAGADDRRPRHRSCPTASRSSWWPSSGWSRCRCAAGRSVAWPASATRCPS